MRIASKEAAAARKARHTHVIAMLNNALPMKAKRVARVMMAKADNVGKDSSDESSDEASEEADAAAPVQRQTLVKPTARMQVFKRNDDALFAPAEAPETKIFKLVTEIDEETHSAFNNAAEEKRFDERYLDLNSLKEDVTDTFRGRFGFYLQRNLMADLQELDCLQDMAKIVQAEVARIGRTYLDAIFLVAYDLLVLRGNGVDAHTAGSIISRVSVRYHLL